MAGDDIHLTDRVSGAEVMELDAISRKSVNITEEARPVQEDVESRIENPPSGYRIQSIAQFTACCWLKMLSGWNDGTSGPLIPRLQEVYQGFLAGAFMNVPLTDKFGFGKVVFFASLCQVVVYALQSAALPFPAYAALFVLNGVGLSLQDAQAVTYVASLKDHPEMKMMLLQASYGAGAFASPLVVVNSPGRPGVIKSDPDPYPQLHPTRRYGYGSPAHRPTVHGSPSTLVTLTLFVPADDPRAICAGVSDVHDMHWRGPATCESKNRASTKCREVGRK
ncbi:hypothetical protein BDZ89DRAFT_1111115 [Hymenopellis radicata]|nr:hypothetical protein BDZ89DRAFT_1111115 [Hymenopellis radicata]